MENNNIDDLFRRQFEADDPGQRFEMQEAHWEAARALLEEKERKRRRALFWWWFAPGVALLLTGGLYFYAHRAAKTDAHRLEVQKEAPVNGQSKGAITAGNATQKAITTPEKTAVGVPSVSEKSGTDTAFANNTPSANKGNVVLPNAPVFKNVEKSTTSKNNAFRSSKKAVFTENGGQNSISNPALVLQNAVAQSGNLPETVNDKQLQADSKVNTTEKRMNDAVEGKDVKQQGLYIDEATPIIITDRYTPVRKPDTAFQVVKNADAVGNAPVSALLQATKDTSAALNAPISAPAKDSVTDIVQLLENQIPIKPYNVPKWQYRAYMAASGYVPEESYRRWLGATAGVQIARHLNEKWQARAGVAWRMTPIADLVSPDSVSKYSSEQKRYSFGLTETRFSFEKWILHSLECPVSVAWRNKKYSLEGGVALGARLLAQTQLTERQRTSLSEETLIKRDNATVKNPALRTIWAVPFVSGQYSLGRAELFARLNLLPGHFAKNTDPEAPPARRFSPAVDIGAVIRIAKRQ
jgi:hypothetical protein